MYTEFYGLKENPFNVTSDPSFLFYSRIHKEAISHLVYGINQKKGFLQITGEVGAGKTTLCKALLNQLEKSTKTAFILNSNLPSIQLLEAILEDFGVTPKKKTKINLFKQLNQFLLSELESGSNVILIIDEAQNLSRSALEEIRMLSNLETDKEKLFQIILVGQPELYNKLNSPELAQLRQRIAVRFHITPLEKDEIDKYIYHRLKVAGSVGDIIFTGESIDKIFEYSGGIPRLINIACDKALLLGYVMVKKNIDIDMIQKSIDEIEGRQVEKLFV